MGRFLFRLERVLQANVCGARSHGRLRVFDFCPACGAVTIHQLAPVCGKDAFDTDSDDALPAELVFPRRYVKICGACQLYRMQNGACVPAREWRLGDTRPAVFRDYDRSDAEVLERYAHTAQQRCRDAIRLAWRMDNAPAAVSADERRAWLESLVGGCADEVQLVAEADWKVRENLPDLYNRAQLIVYGVAYFIPLLIVIANHWAINVMGLEGDGKRWEAPSWMVALVLMAGFQILGGLVLYWRRWGLYTRRILYPRLAKAMAGREVSAGELQPLLDRICDIPEGRRCGWRLDAERILAQAKTLPAQLRPQDGGLDAAWKWD